MSNRLCPTLWTFAKCAQHVNRPCRIDYEQPPALPLWGYWRSVPSMVNLLCPEENDGSNSEVVRNDLCAQQAPR